MSNCGCTRPPQAAWPRRIVTIALALALASPAPASAQAKSYKRWFLGIGGALGVGIPAYAFTSDDAFGSSCSSKECVGIAAALMGGLIGFLVGLEMDNKYARRMAAGPTLNYSFQEISLDLVPDRIAGFPGGAAVIGMGGARVVRRDGSVVSRGSGVRGIEDVVVLPEQNLLVLSTLANLISFDIADDTLAGKVIDARGGGSMEAFESRLAVASLDFLRLLKVTREADDVSVETLVESENQDFITDMAFDRENDVGWVLRANRLAAYGAQLRKVGEFELPAAGRTVRVQHNRMAVAAGTEGVFVYNVVDPVAPRLVQHYTGVKFAYAADVAGGRMYVAAGPEGVAVVDISGGEPVIVGVARETQFATDVVATETGEVWIVDRDGQSVQIADFGAPSAAN